MGIGALPQELISVADGGFDGDCAALGDPNRQRLDHRDAAWCVGERTITDLHPVPSLGWEVERDERRGGAKLCFDAVEAGGGAADFVQRGVGHEDRVGLLAGAAQAPLGLEAAASAAASCWICCAQATAASTTWLRLSTASAAATACAAARADSRS